MTGLRRPAAVAGVAAVIGVAVWALGLQPVSALFIALAAVGVAVLVGRLDWGLEPGVDRIPLPTHDGARRDAQELSWAMAGRGGRVGRRPMLTLRAAAAHRLARHGLDLSSAEDAPAINALIGVRATAVLTRVGGPAPRVGDVVHVVTVLEHLGPGGDARPAAPPRSTP